MDKEQIESKVFYMNLYLSNSNNINTKYLHLAGQCGVLLDTEY